METALNGMITRFYSHSVRVGKVDAKHKLFMQKRKLSAFNLSSFGATALKLEMWF